MEEKIIYSFYCPEYSLEAMIKGFRRMLDFFNLKEILYQRRLLLKPNILSGQPPEKAITTHPLVIRGIGEILSREYKVWISVGDSPGMGFSSREKVEEIYKRSGIYELGDNIESIKFDRFEESEFGPVFSWRENFDYLINIPKLKTHSLMMFTCCVKNLFGLILGSHKALLHLKYPKPYSLAEVILKVYLRNKPLLNIVDAVWCMDKEGPGVKGRVRRWGFIFSSLDGIYLDVYLAQLVGAKPLRVPVLKKAYEFGLWSKDVKIKVVGDEPYRLKFAIPQPGLLFRLPAGLLKLLGNALDFYVDIDRNLCKVCLLCRDICPKGAIRLKENKVSINKDICIRCLCCQEICPQGAISFKKGLRIKKYAGI